MQTDKQESELPKFGSSKSKQSKEPFPTGGISVPNPDGWEVPLHQIVYSLHKGVVCCFIYRIPSAESQIIYTCTIQHFQGPTSSLGYKFQTFALQLNLLAVATNDRGKLTASMSISKSRKVTPKQGQKALHFCDHRSKARTVNPSKFAGSSEQGPS